MRWSTKIALTLATVLGLSASAMADSGRNGRNDHHDRRDRVEHRGNHNGGHYARPRHAPPAVRYEHYRHRPGYHWVSGRYNWTNGGYVWAGGYYQPIRRGHVWVPGYWAVQYGDYVWVDGYWR